MSMRSLPPSNTSGRATFEGEQPRFQRTIDIDKRNKTAAVKLKTVRDAVQAAP